MDRSIDAKGANLVAGSTATDITTVGKTLVVAGPTDTTLFVYITDFSITNGSGSVLPVVSLLDSADNLLWCCFAATNGGGEAKSLVAPIKARVAGSGIYAKCSLDGAQVRVSISGFTGL